jgi:hypothetical protein
MKEKAAGKTAKPVGIEERAALEGIMKKREGLKRDRLFFISFCQTKLPVISQF